jgi:3-(3-hydroxy-phenyl)propionate hydroxylase
MTPPPAPRAARADVLVVGGGPTGLTVANLLGTFGVRTTLIERNASTSNEAKAISLDDESLRAMQLAGLDTMIYPIIVPGTGTRYFSARGRMLLHARGPGTRRYGHPFKSAFAQPDLEQVLAEGLGRFPHVSARFGTALQALQQTADGVAATVAEAGGSEYVITSRYLLACDGGRSQVRELLSIPMSGRTFQDRWLVVDTLGDHHDQRYGMHFADPRRPHVIIPGAGGRCRYEFRLFGGEAGLGPQPPFDLVQRLVGRYRTLDPGQIERAVVYCFHALLADRYGVGRCFLLGDAAHMMPPFAGQGLNSGVRDAMNLAWKLAAVLSGQADPVLLDTYEQERRPHARAVIDLSVRMGSIVMTTSRPRARLRDILAAGAMRIPPIRKHLEEMRFRPSPVINTALTLSDRGKPGLVGRPLPQPLVFTGPAHRVTRMDEVLGDGPAILGVDLDPASWSQLDGMDLRPLGGTRIDVRLDDRAARPACGRAAIVDMDGNLDAALGGAHGSMIFVRPDRIVAAMIDPRDVGQLAAALAPFQPCMDSSGIQAVRDVAQLLYPPVTTAPSGEGTP